MKIKKFKIELAKNMIIIKNYNKELQSGLLDEKEQFTSEVEKDLKNIITDEKI